MYLAPNNLHRFDPKRWDYADLVVEIVSPDDPDRDYIEKRDEYATAGIPEYWIIDPGRQQVTQLTLDAGAYRETVQPIRSVVRSSVTPEIVVDLGSLYEQASTMPGQA
jgi:Uma2 family endonuclease